jgi:aryl-alcohol dehydrogenase-like predicted oxidoreductase
MHRYTRRDSLKAGLAAGTVALVPGLAATVAAAAEPERKLATRPIPRTGEALPVIGIGTSQVFDIGSDPAERAPRRQVLDAMIAGGATIIDTAPSYARAEAVVGELLAERQLRPKFFVATKVGVKDPAAQQAELAKSLVVLKTPRVDLMQLHNVRDANQGLAFLREFQQAGKTRYVGVTHWMDSSHDLLTTVVTREKPDFLQINYSLDARHAEERLLPAAKDAGVAVLVNVPFGRNRLFNAVRGRELPGFAKELGATSWAQLFLKFILANDAVTAIIPGTDKPEYLVDNIAAGSGPAPTAAQRRQILDYWASIS